APVGRDLPQTIRGSDALHRCDQVGGGHFGVGHQRHVDRSDAREARRIAPGPDTSPYWLPMLRRTSTLPGNAMLRNTGPRYSAFWVGNGFDHTPNSPPPQT